MERNTNLKKIDDIILNNILSKNSTNIGTVNSIYEKYINHFIVLFENENIESLFNKFIKMTDQRITLYEYDFINKLYCNFIKFLCSYYINTNMFKDDTTYFIYIYNGVNFSIYIEDLGYHGSYTEYTPKFNICSNIIAKDIINKKITYNENDKSLDIDKSIQYFIDKNISISKVESYIYEYKSFKEQLDKLFEQSIKL